MYPHSEYTLPVLEKEKALGGLPISILLGVKKADFFFFQDMSKESNVSQRSDVLPSLPSNYSHPENNLAVSTL